ncbi:MAG: hypothetical protein L7F78_17380, partial [Syntrophales bacterium LBB04]|nr:hypothetical protein [Syntrophales bacterium LBB04]
MDPQISLYVKIIGIDIIELTGTVEIHIDCIGLDGTGTIVNVYALDSYEAMEDAIERRNSLLPGAIKLLSGVLSVESEEKYDIFTVYRPTFQPVKA